MTSASQQTRIEGYNLGALAGRAFERERIIELIQFGEWAGNSLAEDRENLIALIKEGNTDA